MDRHPPVIRMTGRPARRHLVRYWTTMGRTMGRPTDPSSGLSSFSVTVPNPLYCKHIDIAFVTIISAWERQQHV